MADSDWLTVAEAAAYCGSKDRGGQVIRAAIHNGDLPAYRYGKGAIRLRASDLDEWLEAHPYEPRTAS